MPGGALTRWRRFKSPLRLVGFDPGWDRRRSSQQKRGANAPRLTILLDSFFSLLRLVCFLSCFLSCFLFVAFSNLTEDTAVVRPIRHRRPT